MADLREQRWQTASDLAWTHYDDSEDWVVFHPQSGDVHLLTASAHLLWTLIFEQRASTLAELAVTLAEALGRAADDELTGATRETLAFMDRAGLVRPIPL